MKNLIRLVVKKFRAWRWDTATINILSKTITTENLSEAQYLIQLGSIEKLASNLKRNSIENKGM